MVTLANPPKLRLNEHGYICDRLMEAMVTSAIQTRPVGGAVLSGPAGAGKTFLAEKVAESLDAPLFVQQMFPGSREDDLLMKLVPDNEHPGVVKNFPGVLVEAAELSHESQVVVLLDEWDKSRPSADSFLLDFLQSGRIRHGGVKMQANQDNLVVFLTSNAEREFSEPLQRRLPRIDVSMPTPAMVHDLLVQSHQGHPYGEMAVLIYAKAQEAGLGIEIGTKPVTPQELRQFLDALTQLGKEADWDSVVYTYLTKSVEAHNRLIKVLTGKGVDTTSPTAKGRLPLNVFSGMAPIEADSKRRRRTMPKLRPDLEFKQAIETPSEPVSEDEAKVGTALLEGKYVYDFVVKEEILQSLRLPVDPAKPGQFFVRDGVMYSAQPITMDHLERLLNRWTIVRDFLGDGDVLSGEVSVTLPDFKVGCLFDRDCLDNGRFFVTTASKTEVVAKSYNGEMSLRWTKDLVTKQESTEMLVKVPQTDWNLRNLVYRCGTGNCARRQKNRGESVHVA